jgi:hypothetical protein
MIYRKLRWGLRISPVETDSQEGVVHCETL